MATQSLNYPTWLRLSDVLSSEQVRINQPICHLQSHEQQGNMSLIDQLHQRLKDYWILVANVSGLLSGFAYVVSTAGIEFGEGSIVGVKLRDIYAFLITTSFITSLAATLLATLLYGTLNVLGPEHSKQFVKKYYWICGKPLTLCIIGVFFMMLSQLPFLATAYHVWVFWYGIVLLIAFVAGMLYFYVLLRGETIVLVNGTKDEQVHLNEAGLTEVISNDTDMESGLKAE